VGGPGTREQRPLNTKSLSRERENRKKSSVQLGEKRSPREKGLSGKPLASGGEGGFSNEEVGPSVSGKKAQPSRRCEEGFKEVHTCLMSDPDSFGGQKKKEGGGEGMTAEKGKYLYFRKGCRARELA